MTDNRVEVYKGGFTRKLNGAKVSKQEHDAVQKRHTEALLKAMSKNG